MFLTLFSHINDIFLIKERVHWCHGIWDYFYVPIISRLLIEMICRVSYSRWLRCVIFGIGHNGATSPVLSFPTCGFISIILDCWCFIYELLCNKFTLLVQIIIYWKKMLERFLKDAFFPFVKYVKNLCCSVQR